MDSSATTLLSKMNNRGKHKFDRCLPSEDYSHLTPEEKDLWRKLMSNMKSIILKGRNSKNRPNDKFNSN